MNRSLRLFGGIFCLTSATLYLLAELVSALASSAPLEAYFLHTISELGVPLGGVFDGLASDFSPLYRYMNGALILAGLTFLPCSYFCIADEIGRGTRAACLVFAFFAGLGVAGVGIFHQGSQSVTFSHNFSAFSAFFCGNVFLLLTGLFIRSPIFRKISLVLGIAGLTSVAVMIVFIFSPLSAFQAIPERLTVYTLVIWEIVGGVRLLRPRSEKKGKK